MFFERDVIFHFAGDKQEEVSGTSVDFSKNKFVSTVYEHHTNPVYSRVLEEAINNPLVIATIREKTEKFYSKVGRPDYKRIATEKMYNQRLKSKGCHCKWPTNKRIKLSPYWVIF